MSPIRGVIFLFVSLYNEGVGVAVRYSKPHKGCKHVTELTTLSMKQTTVSLIKLKRIHTLKILIL